MKKTIVYVDGFNFYYGLFESTECAHLKWLDLWRLFSNILGTSHQLQEVKYFTSKIKNNVARGQRQQNYFRALRTTPNNGVNIIEGNYTRKEKRWKFTAQLLDGKVDGKITLRIPEEKESDVNLATHLLNDAWRGAFDCAVIASNDSDLVGALRLIKEQPQFNQKTFILVTPGEKILRKNNRSSRTTSNALWEALRGPQKDTVQKRIITKEHLQKAQFPDTIPANTTIHKPPEW